MSTAQAAVVFTAPASKVLTGLHIPEAGQPAGTAPVTRCGIPMVQDELWQQVGRKAGDRLCEGCAPYVTADRGPKLVLHRRDPGRTGVTRCGQPMSGEWRQAAGAEGTYICAPCMPEGGSGDPVEPETGGLW